MNTVDKQ